MSKLYIIVEEGELKPYQSIGEALENYGDLAEFVVHDRNIVCLTLKNKSDWEIETVPLKDIAKAILERKE